MIVLALALALLPGCTDPGAIAYVHDGDTVKRCDGQRLRLSTIDAPEVKGSPSCSRMKRASHWCDYALGEQARDALEAFLAGGKPVITYSGRIDPYRRPLVRISVNGVDAGDWLMARGLARRW
jgi:endonuclease YncB( thermonuclease family)